MFRNLFKIVERSPNFVSFDDQIKWLLCNPSSDYSKELECHYGMGYDSYHTEIYFDTYLIYSACDRRSNEIYFKSNRFSLIKIYLIDDTFNTSMIRDMYNDSKFCYPLIYEMNWRDTYINDGPWIDKLKQYIHDYNIKESFLTNKRLIDMKIQQLKLDEEAKKLCCESKKKHILDAFK